MHPTTENINDEEYRGNLIFKMMRILAFMLRLWNKLLCQMGYSSIGFASNKSDYFWSNRSSCRIISSTPYKSYPLILQLAQRFPQTISVICYDLDLMTCFATS